MITEFQILDIIDGTAPTELMERHRQLFSTDLAYRNKFAFFESLDKTLDNFPLDSPSMRFTDNVLDKLQLSTKPTRVAHKAPLYWALGVSVVACIIFALLPVAPSAVNGIAPATNPILLSVESILLQLTAVISGRWAAHVFLFAFLATLLMLFDKKVLNPYFRHKGLA